VNFSLSLSVTRVFRGALYSFIGKKAFLYGHKYGYFALLLSWLPIVGDPLTIVAGLVRLKFVWFVIIAGVLRVARYMFIAYILSF